MHLRLFQCFLFLFITCSIFAQNGRWTGTLEVYGQELNLSIKLEEQNDSWSGTLDIPAQQIKGMPLEKLSVSDDSLSFSLPKVPGNARYAGAFNADASFVEGLFYQSGLELALNLELQGELIDPADLANYRILVDSLLEELQVVGAGIGIVKSGEVVLSEGFGYRDLENEVEADGQTLFAIGSASKAFTTAGLAMLVDEGKLEWDKPIINYLPDFRLYDDYATQEMTAIDLVTHQSGLPRHDVMWYATDFSRQEIYNRLRYLEPNKSFRSTWQYNNLMYMTAGILIERLSGKSWEEYTKERLFDALNMTQTNTSVDVSQQQANFSFPYQVKEEETAKMDFFSLDDVGPAGSINSNVADMLQWLQFHLALGKKEGQELLSEAQVKKMHTPHKTMTATGTGDNNFGPTAYGLGWFTQHYGDTYIVQHGGNIDGFSALSVLLPKEDIGIVVLCNQNGSRFPGTAARYAIDFLLDKKPVDWYQPDEDEEEENEEAEEEKKEDRIVGTQPHHAMADYTGIYEHPGYGEISIEAAGDSMKLTYYQFEMPLSHWHFETFRGHLEKLGADYNVTFQTGSDGRVTALELPLELMVDPIHFERRPPDLLSDENYLNSLVGTYELDEVPVEVKVRSQTLTVTLPGQPTYTLVPKSENRFELKSLNGFFVEFAFENEKASTLTFHQPNGTFVAKRKEE